MKKILLFLISAVILLTTVACSSESDEGVLATKIERVEWMSSFNGEPSEDLTHVVLVNTEEDLEQLKLNSEENRPKFYNIIDSYDKDFFEDNSLVLCYFVENGITYNYEVKDVNCNDSVLTAIVSGTDKKKMAPNGLLITIEVKDELAASCTDFNFRITKN